MQPIINKIIGGFKVRLFTVKEIRALKSAVNKRQRVGESNDLYNVYNAVKNFEKKGKDTSVKIIE